MTKIPKPLISRPDGRKADELRQITFTAGVAPAATGSVLIRVGHTQVLCGVTIENSVPRWMKALNPLEQGQSHDGRQ